MFVIWPGLGRAVPLVLVHPQDIRKWGDGRCVRSEVDIAGRPGGEQRDLQTKHTQAGNDNHNNDATTLYKSGPLVTTTLLDFIKMCTWFCRRSLRTKRRNEVHEGTWKWTRGVGARGRLVPIMRTMLRYWPHSWLSHTGTSYRQRQEHAVTENRQSHQFSSSYPLDVPGESGTWSASALTISGVTPKYSRTMRSTCRTSSASDILRTYTCSSKAPLSAD